MQDERRSLAKEDEIREEEKCEKSKDKDKTPCGFYSRYPEANEHFKTNQAAITHRNTTTCYLPIPGLNDQTMDEPPLCHKLGQSVEKGSSRMITELRWVRIR